MKLAEIAEIINAHLKRLEADKEYNVPIAQNRIHKLYCACSWAAGAYVGVRYVSFQSGSMLRKAEALAYLAWLDAGN